MIFKSSIFFKTGSKEYKYLKKYEFNRDWTPKLIDYCKKKKIDFVASPFDKKACDLLIKNKVPAIKIASTETFNLNLKSVFFLIQKLVPLMEANATKDDPSKVINIASIDGVGIADYDSYPYTASKAGLIHLTRSLGKVLVEKNIYVNGIAPGAFPTDMNEMARDNPQVLGAFVPNYRVGNKEDIGGSCIYLASKASNYVIGETIVVDGGWTSVAYGGMMSRHLKEEI